MKKSLLAGVSLGVLALATGAQAADVVRPVYKAPMAQPVWSWAGFYVGANVGIAAARSSVADDVPSTIPWIGGSLSSNRAGVIGGLQAGYNWQFNQLVLGVEGDVSIAGLNKSTAFTDGIANISTYNTQVDALATLRGRFGWAFDRTLVYATGGLAYASLRDQIVDTSQPFTASPRSDVFGWTAGAGVEFALVGRWTAKAEYLYVGLPNRNVTTTSGGTYSFAFKDSLSIGRVGINYKF